MSRAYLCEGMRHLVAFRVRQKARGEWGRMKYPDTAVPKRPFEKSSGGEKSS
jgi:hypothetical protein